MFSFNKKKIVYFVLITAVLLVVGLYVWNHWLAKPVEWMPQNALEQAPAPRVSDGRDTASLVTAIDNSLRYLDRVDEQAVVSFGKDSLPNARIRETLLDFKTQLNEYGLTREFFQYVEQNYRFYRTAAKEALFTGYFEMDLKGSLTASERYKYPLYRKPVDLYRVDLSDFYFYQRQKKLPRILRARLTDKHTLVPYYSRQEIDDQQVLSDRGLEIAWIDNPISVFFLHIQGSGIVELDTGGTLRVNYAESNGHPYRSIGKRLIDQGAITYENMSMQSIWEYLARHPDQQGEVFNYNPSYVFFREVEEGPLGSLNVPVTAFRSIATDRRLFPRGALCYVETELPVFNSKRQVQGWREFRGFVLNQDTGGAIRGPGRVDVFTGYGEQSRLIAGHMKQTGRFYFLSLRAHHVGRELPVQFL